MKKIKRILVTLMLVIAASLLVVTVVYRFAGDVTIFTLLTKHIGKASGTHITFRQDVAITRSLMPVVKVNDLQIEDVNKGFLVAFDSLQFQLNLADLLFGKVAITRLESGDILVEIQGNSEPGELTLPESMPFEIALDDVWISQISVIWADSKYVLPAMHIGRLPSTSERLGLNYRVETAFSGQEMVVDLQIPRSNEIDDNRLLPFYINAQWGEVDFSVDGQIDFGLPSLAIEASIEGVFSELQQIVVGAAGSALYGELIGQAQINGSAGKFDIEALSISWQEPGESTATLSGRIDDIIGLAELDLDLIGQLDKPIWLEPLVPDSLEAISNAELSARITGCWERPVVKDFELHLKTEEALDLSLSGQFDVVHNQADFGVANVDIGLIFTAPTTRAARSLLFEQVWEFGPITGKAEVRSSGSGDPALENIVVLAESENGVGVALDGTIASFPLDPDRPNTGYDLAVYMGATETVDMSEVLGVNLPMKGPLAVSYKIGGDTEALQLNDIELSAGEKNGVQLDVGGELLFGDWGKTDPLQSIDLAISIDSSDTQSLAVVIGQQLPELGAINAQAHLHTVSGKQRIDDLNIRLGESAVPAVTANGSINPLAASDDIDFVVNFNFDGQSFAPLADLSDPIHLSGDMVVSNSDGSLGIDTLRVKSEESKLLNLVINGEFDDFEDVETLALDVELTAHDLQLLGTLFDLQWPAIGPVELTGLIKNKGEGVELDIMLIAGETRVDAEISGFSNVNPPRISGKITARKFFLPSLPNIANGETRENDSGENYLFSRQPIDLDWLKKVDMDLSVDIESFDEKRSQIESARFEVNLESGMLVISPAELTYSEGKLEIDMRLDAQDIPQVSLKAFGENINPWLTLDMQKSRVNSEFKGELDVEIEFISSGASEHDLAANAEGDVYVIVKNGMIRKKMLHLVFVDVVGWTLGKVLHDEYAEVKCGVADYSIKQGVIETKALFVDTPNIMISGEGSIDLANEKIDYVLLPKKKTKLIRRASPVSVKGVLDAPSIRAISLKSAVTNYGSLFFSPYLFAGIIATEFMSESLRIKGAESPCREYEKKRQLEQEMIN